MKEAGEEQVKRKYKVKRGQSDRQTDGQTIFFSCIWYLKAGRIVGSINDVSVMLNIELRLGTQFASKELDRIRGRTRKGLGNIHRIHHHRLYAVSFTLHLENVGKVEKLTILNYKT